MGKLQTEVDSKALVINELTRITKEKDKSIKAWEEQSSLVINEPTMTRSRSLILV